MTVFVKREDPVVNLNGVATTGAGSGVLASDCRAVAAIIRVTGTTSCTVKVQGCETDSSTDANWWDLDSVALTTAGTTEVLVEFPPAYVRTNVTTHSNGTVTTQTQRIL